MSVVKSEGGLYSHMSFQFSGTDALASKQPHPRGDVRWFLGFTSRSRVRCVQCLRRRPHARRCIRNTRPIQAGDLRSAPAGALFVDVAFDLCKFIFLGMPLGMFYATRHVYCSSIHDSHFGPIRLRPSASANFTGSIVCIRRGGVIEGRLGNIQYKQRGALRHAVAVRLSLLSSCLTFDS